ncbi:MAG: alanine racemase [bacterium]
MDFSIIKNSFLLMTIDLDAIEENTRNIKASLGDDVKLLAVVKSDAYGHGLIEASRACLSGGADWLGIVNVREGVMLREGGISAPTIVLGSVLPTEVNDIFSYNLDTVVFTKGTVEALASVCKEPDKQVGVFVKIDTGMGRLGIYPEEVCDFVRFISTIPSLYIKGLMTHFPTAYFEDKTFTLKQIEIFKSLINKLRDNGFDLPLNNCANSAAIMSLPSARFEMVRAGIALYGYYPSEFDKRTIKLRPAMSLKARVMYLRKVKRGTPISYGSTYITDKETYIGVIPIGYKHGYMRALSGKAYAICKGKIVRQVGVICMDMSMFDFGEKPDIEEYEWVTLMGEDGSKAVWADELAEYAGTIPYEIMTSLSGRIDKVYIQGGEIVGYKRVNNMNANQ